MPQQSQTGSSVSWKDAPTKWVDVDGTKFVYRQLGPDTGVPVIFLNHLAGELDRWDPRVVDGIAAKCRVIAFDSRGIGASEGSTPNSAAAMARDAVAFIRAMGLEQVDLHGFSLGGFISQVTPFRSMFLPSTLQKSRRFSREYLAQRALRQLPNWSANVQQHPDFFLQPAGNEGGRVVSFFMVNRHGVDPARGWS